jgi:hypothetical protein
MKQLLEKYWISYIKYLKKLVTSWDVLFIIYFNSGKKVTQKRRIKISSIRYEWGIWNSLINWGDLIFRIEFMSYRNSSK